MDDWYVISREPSLGQTDVVSDKIAQFANESLAKEFARQIYSKGLFIEARGSKQKYDRTNVAAWLAAK
jgi:hypothetical protein